MRSWQPLTLVILAASCTQAPLADDTSVTTLVQERIKKSVHYDQDPDCLCLIELLLQKELSLPAAIQIALFNNKTLRATFEELGIAQADLIQAGLLHNPLFEGVARLPTKGKGTTNTEFSITQNFIDLFLIPLKKKVAKSELELVQLHIAQACITLAFDVEQAYYKLQAALTNLTYLEQITALSEIEKEIAKRQYDTGNCNERIFKEYEALHLHSALNLQKGYTVVAALKNELSLLLSIPQTNWHISKELPSQVCLPIEKDLLEISYKQRLDLQHALLMRDKLIKIGATKQWWSYTEGALGAAWETDVDGTKLFGPKLQLSIPLFNTGQAERARLLSELKQAQHTVDALKSTISSDLLQTVTLIKILQDQIAEKRLLIQQQTVTTSHAMYSVMGLSLYKLLDTKKNELEAKIAHTEMLRDFWLAKVALERTIGGNL